MSIENLFSTVYFIPGPTNVGVIADTGEKQPELYLVDSGMNEDDGKRIYAELKKAFPESSGGFRLKAIINTHSHADHCGGNKFLFDSTGCEIWATEGESGSMINPFIQAAVIWGGNPIQELTTSYYMPQNTTPTKIIKYDEKIRLKNNLVISFIPLPGHYFDMAGIICSEENKSKAVFSGDAFFGREHIFKYWIPFIYDVKTFKQSLDVMSETEAGWFIPSHGNAMHRVEETIEMNKIAILSTEFCILHVLRTKDLTSEEILQQVAQLNNIKLKTAQFALINCTLKAYLTYLNSEHKISYYIQENKMLWHIEKNSGTI